MMYLLLDLQKNTSVTIDSYDSKTQKCQAEISTDVTDYNGSFICSESVYLKGTPDQLRQIANDILAKLPEEQHGESKVA